MERKRLEIVSLMVLCIAILILTFFVFRPFFTILILATILSMIFRPIYEKMLRVWKGGRNFFAFLFVFAGLVLVILPILFLGLKILIQIQVLLTMVQNGQVSHLYTFQHTIETMVRHVFPNFSFDVSDYSSQILTFISSNLGVLISQTANIFAQTFFLLFAFFFFLRDGEHIFYSLMSLSPFDEAQNKEITRSIHNAITSVTKGTLFIGLIRGILFTVGFYLVGIPSYMIWGGIATLVGIIPGLGTIFVIVASVLYLVFAGNVVGAIGIGSLGVLLVFFIDNMLSVYFFGKGLDAPPVFILFSILGGVIFFGPLGFIFGPIVLSLCISIIEMYRVIILKPKIE